MSYETRPRHLHLFIILIPAPTAGVSVECKSCGQCPWMQMNTLEKLYESLINKKNEIKLSSDIIQKACISLDRMIQFKP